MERKNALVGVVVLEQSKKSRQANNILVVLWKQKE